MLDTIETLPIAAETGHRLARQALQRAQGAFQKWPEGFAGFTAQILCRVDDLEARGDVRVVPGGRVEVLLEPPVLRGWASRALQAIAHARTPRFFKDGDGRFPISFEAGDVPPLTHRIRVAVGADLWRLYALDAKGLIREQETAGPARQVRVYYDTLVRTSPGRVVPTRMRLLEWAVAAQTPLEAAEIEDEYHRVEHVLLPVRRRVTRIRDGAYRSLTLELERHVVLAK